jgi:hypothetical protein
MNRKEEIIEQSLTLFKAGFRTTYAVSQVLKRAKWLHLIHERQCDGYSKHYGASSDFEGGNWDAEAEKRDEAREERIKAQLAELFTEQIGVGEVYLTEEEDGKPRGIGIAFQGDPRGAPLIVYKDGQELGRVWG